MWWVLLFVFHVPGEKQSPPLVISQQTNTKSSLAFSVFCAVCWYIWSQSHSTVETQLLWFIIGVCVHAATHVTRR